MGGRGVENGGGSYLFESLKREGHEKKGSAKKEGHINLRSCDHKEHCILISYYDRNYSKVMYKRQLYKFTRSQKQDKLLKYKCKVNVYQEHIGNILCYKFIFNQNINCQMSQKNLLLLSLFFFFKEKKTQSHNLQ